MKIFIKKNKSGFTLVEALIYATLFVLIIGAIVTSIVVLSNSYRNIKAVRDVETSGVSSMDRIVREIKGANSIDGSGTVYNSALGSILLNTTDESDDPITLRFYLSNGVIRMDKSGTYFGQLTDDSVTVTSLTFKPITSSSSVAVKIEMNIQNSNSRNVVNKNFYMSAIIRESQT